MKNVLKSLTLMALALAIALPLAGQDAKKKKKKGKKERPNPAVAFASQVKKRVADLSEGQTKKLDGLAAEFGPKIVEANKAVGADVQRARGAARKKAAEAGKKGKELRAAVDAAVQLTDEQKEAMAKAQKLNREFRQAVAKLLTAEQKEKAGLVRGKKKGGDKKKKKKDAA